MTADVEAVVVRVARAVEADLPRLTVEMTDWFIEVIPQFRQDETARQLMVASTSANLVAIVDMLAHSIPIEQVSVPPAAAEYARRFAQHDLSLEALLRAYRLGEHRFGQWAIEVFGQVDEITTPTALAALSEIGVRTNSYIDQVIEALIDIYETERRKWDSRTGAARAAQIRTILENDGLTEESAQAVIGAALGCWHQAAVVWAPPDATDAEHVLQAASRILQNASGRAPLTMLADDRTLWCWLSSPQGPTLDRERLRGLLDTVPTDLRIALGGPATGLAGFRATLREAVRARSVSESAAGDRGRLIDFDDVAIPALLTGDAAALRHWVGRILGDLANDDPATDRLRRTVRVFLGANGSFTEAAARLHLHKNTVHYRVRKAEDVRGRAIGADRLEVEVALAACDLLRRRDTDTFDPSPAPERGDPRPGRAGA